jgi:ADP-ribose pyrophosphatase YjhB (NUDIX family)
VKFCGECGNRTQRAWIAADGRARDMCPRCGHIHYENPRILVSCFAYWQDRLLMCRRAHEPEYGKWITPSGFVEAGETLEAAAARETREETGVEIPAALMRLYSVASLPDINEVYISFRAQLLQEPKPVAGSDSLEAALQSVDEICWSELAFRDWLGDYPRHFFRQLRSRQFPIHQIQLSGQRMLGSDARAADQPKSWCRKGSTRRRR